MRFDELNVAKLWIVPAAAFWLAAAGFVGGVITESNRKAGQPEIVASAVPTQIATGIGALGIYSWIFGLAVKDAALKGHRRESK